MKQWMSKPSPQRVRELGQNLMVQSLYMLFVLAVAVAVVRVVPTLQVKRGWVVREAVAVLSLLNGFPHRI
jgi:hypothetical protein